MANLDRSKKLLVRVALVSGSTVATLVGAQTVAFLDQNPRITESLPAGAPTAVVTLPPPTTIPTVAPIHQAPSVIILRPQSSAPNNARPANNTPVIQPHSAQAILPPNPQAISAPAPVVVQQQQQQAPAVSRSSR
jgi:hypothetical protein